MHKIELGLFSQVFHLLKKDNQVWQSQTTNIKSLKLEINVMYCTKINEDIMPERK